MSSGKPTAMWATCFTAGAWQTERNSWGARFMEDAGAVNVLADRGLPYQTAMAEEQIINLTTAADFWLTINPRQTSATGLPARAFKAATTGRIYDPFRALAEFKQPDYFGQAMIRPDLMLRDLVSLFHPELLPAHQLFFWQRQT